MAKKVIWSSRAIASFDKIIDYLEKEWTEKDVRNFIFKTQKTITQIESDTILFRTSGKRNIHEVLVSKHNLLLYRIRKNHIDLLVFYDTRRHPKKKKF